MKIQVMITTSSITEIQNIVMIIIKICLNFFKLHKNILQLIQPITFIHLIVVPQSGSMNTHPIQLVLVTDTMCKPSLQPQ